jgi:TorA maturation chaperone TorD
MPDSVRWPTGNFEEASGVLGLLSLLWHREADARTLRALRQPPLSVAWKKAGGTLPADITAELVDELATDYCRLLIGPQHRISPVQSIWEQSRFQGAAAASMRRYVEMLDGFRPCVEIIDHVAVQLQYAATLTGLATQTRGSLIQGLGKAFARDHLEWTSVFFEGVEEKAETEFYRSLAQVSRGFLFDSQ